MNKYVAIFFIQLFAATTLSAQFFSGYYVSDPPMDEFEHLKVHHHHFKHDKYHGDLSVKGFSEFGELWELKATMITGDRAAKIISKFGEEEKVETVYEFKIAVDGIEEDFILLGYVGRRGHPEFIAIEEIFASEQEIDLLELKSFKLIKAHHLHN